VSEGRSYQQLAARKDTTCTHGTYIEAKETRGVDRSQQRVLFTKLNIFKYACTSTASLRANVGLLYTVGVTRNAAH